MNILGLNVFHADTAAAIICNGKVKAAIEEERLNRIKHTDKFPINSIKFCLKKAQLTINEIDYIAVNYNKFYNIKEKFFFFKKLNIFARNKHFSNRLVIKNLKKEFKNNFRGKIINVPHHLAHISSSYFASGLKKSCGITIDGSGDFSTFEYFHCNNNNINLVSKVYFPNSLGLLYQAITQFLGFVKFGDEYKVMALAALGKPKYINQFKKIFVFEPPYEFTLKKKIFSEKFFKDRYKVNDIIFNKKKGLTKLFGKPRNPKEAITSKHKDIACSLQFFFEDIILKILKNISIENYSNNLCISGGCFFNSVLNGKIINKLNFNKVFLHPNCGDAGGSLGAALYVANKYSNKLKRKEFLNNYLGSIYNNKQVQKSITENKNLLINFTVYKIDSFSKINFLVSKALNEKKIVGWFQDRSEWGPRALGNRSILADSSIKNVKDLINKKIKLREKFRPFACSILEEKASEFFFINKNIKINFPNMNFVFKAKNIVLRKFPSIVHNDGSSRIQTVNSKNNKKFYNLINTFYKKYRKPILLNTSLNINNPICDSPNDVIRTFYKTDIDLIVMQNFILVNKKLGNYIKI
jgi:carbamoyltransferase